jgi:hypothetical protein
MSPDAMYHLKSIFDQMKANNNDNNAEIDFAQLARIYVQNMTTYKPSWNKNFKAHLINITSN